jgi:PAS domain S-box-containing protein
MIDVNQQIQVLFELLIVILNEPKLENLIKKFLTALLKKLNCSAGGVYFNVHNDETNKMNKYLTIPVRPETIEPYKMALYLSYIAKLHTNEQNDMENQFPIIGSTSDSEHYYVFALDELGSIIFIKNGKKLNEYLIKSLPLIFSSLSTNCKLLLQNKKLEKTHQVLHEQNLELIRLNEMNKTVLQKTKVANERLIASEHKYKSLYNNIKLGIYRTTVDGKILLANPALINMLGYKELKKLNITENGYTNSFQRLIFQKLMSQEGHVYNFESQWKKKDGTTIYIKENADAIKNDKGEIIFYDGYVEDITEKKETELKLQKRDIQLQILERFENLLMTLATEFITISVNEMDSAINKLLKKIGLFTKIDRAYLFAIDSTKNTMSNTHEWVAKGVSAEIDNLQDLPTSIFPWWIKQLSANKVIHFENLESMPSAAYNEKELLEQQNIKAIVVLPIFVDKVLYGFIGFDSVRKQKKWETAIVTILQMVTLLISNMVSRHNTIMSLDAKTDKYRTLFLDSPIALLEEDLSKFKKHIDKLKDEGVTDFKEYLKDYDHIRELASLIEINWANKTALNFYEVSSLEELGSHLHKLVPVSDYPKLANGFLHIIRGERKINMRIKNLTSNGTIKDIDLNWVVSSRYHESLSSTIVSLIDITERLDYEHQIHNSLLEKERLLSEIHHRVKNNMQMVAAMLELQTDYLNEHNTKESFIIASNRIQSMSLIHEKLYETKNFGEIDLQSYLSDLVTSLVESYQGDKHVSLDIQIEKNTMEIDSAITCGLLLNEIITNSLKHAYTDNRDDKQLKVHMVKQKNKKFKLIVQDNGKGLPEDFDINTTKSLGIQLIKGFINELKGTYDIKNESGTIYDIEIEAMKKSRQ